MKTHLSTAWLVALLVSTPSVAFAGGFEITEHGFYVIDVVILLLILRAFVKEPAVAFMQKRHETAKAEMKTSMASLTEAQERLESSTAALANADTEAKELAEAFEADGKREATRIGDETTKAAARIRRDAAETVARETSGLRQNIERDLAIEALAKAEGIIEARLDAETHRVLIDNFITELEAREDLSSFKVV